MLTIPLEKLAFIVVKAREFDVKVDPVMPEEDSDPADDGEREVLEEREDDATEEELLDALADLNSDEMDELLALVWIGRGDFDKSEWHDALTQARSAEEQRNPSNLLQIPLLADFIEAGLDALGYSLTDFEADHL